MSAENNVFIFLVHTYFHEIRNEKTCYEIESISPKREVSIIQINFRSCLVHNHKKLFGIYYKKENYWLS